MVRILVFSYKIYGQDYFKYKYEYERKRDLIEHYYRKILKWADRVSDRSLLNGEGKSALDLGCAYGFVVELLDRLGYAAVGIDISQYAVQSGRNVVDEEFFLAEASHLPFRAESFNIITCFEVLEHLENPSAALIDIYNCLRLGGVFVATTPTTSLGAKLIGRVTKENCLTHPSVKHPEAWIEKLARLKFAKIFTETFLLLPIHPFVFNRYFTFKCLYPFASHVKLVAVKLPLKEGDG
jgi:2-polyprenyl-3-methyl-5-hydroxy-6-metoxy-1,4-benzoquinol methylase